MMSRWCAPALMVALAATAGLVNAHDLTDLSQAPPKVSHSVIYHPTALPDRVVLTWRGDTRTTQAVTWRTSTEVTLAMAEIAEAESGPDFTKRARRLAAATHPHTSDLSKCHVHSVDFTELKPGTKYAYRVGDGVNWSEWFQFRTAADAPEPFSFLYFGDAQNDLRSMWSRVIREAHADAPRAAFTLHAGDLINRAEDDAGWGEWFGAGGWMNGMIPVIATPGNHEYASKEVSKGKTVRWLTRHWDKQFAFPRNGPSGLETSVYYIDYQNLRVVSLNSNERQAEQVPWLEKALAESRANWNVVTFHHPIYSMAKKRDNPELRAAWKPVFDRYHVDLVLTGHDHSYGRSGLLVGEDNITEGTNWRSEPTGTVYVVSVSGPKMYEIDTNPHVAMRRVAESTQLYQVISIDGPTLHYESRTATGELYDAFTLKKEEGKVNELVDQTPPTPIRRLPRKQEDTAAE